MNEQENISTEDEAEEVQETEQDVSQDNETETVTETSDESTDDVVDEVDNEVETADENPESELSDPGLVDPDAPMTPNELAQASEARANAERKAKRELESKIDAEVQETVKNLEPDEKGFYTVDDLDDYERGKLRLEKNADYLSEKQLKRLINVRRARLIYAAQAQTSDAKRPKPKIHVLRRPENFSPHIDMEMSCTVNGKTDTCKLRIRNASGNFAPAEFNPKGVMAVMMKTMKRMGPIELVLEEDQQEAI